MSYDARYDQPSVDFDDQGDTTPERVQGVIESDIRQFLKTGQDAGELVARYKTTLPADKRQAGGELIGGLLEALGAQLRAAEIRQTYGAGSVVAEDEQMLADTISLLASARGQNTKQKVVKSNSSSNRGGLPVHAYLESQVKATLERAKSNRDTELVNALDAYCAVAYHKKASQVSLPEAGAAYVETEKINKALSSKNLAAVGSIAVITAMGFPLIATPAHAADVPITKTTVTSSVDAANAMNILKNLPVATATLAPAETTKTPAADEKQAVLSTQSSNVEVISTESQTAGSEPRPFVVKVPAMPKNPPSNSRTEPAPEPKAPKGPVVETISYPSANKAADADVAPLIINVPGGKDGRGDFGKTTPPPEEKTPDAKEPKPIVIIIDKDKPNERTEPSPEPTPPAPEPAPKKDPQPVVPKPTPAPEAPTPTPAPEQQEPDAGPEKPKDLSKEVEYRMAAEKMIARGGEWVNRGKVMLGLMKAGNTPWVAAGYVANFEVEAPGLDPSTMQGGGGPGRGLAQWEFSGRFVDLQNFAISQGKPWNDLDVQIAFVLHELATTEQRANGIVRGSQNLHDAVMNVRVYYERPGTPHDDRRLAAGDEVYAGFEAALKDVRAEQQKKVDDYNKFHEGKGGAKAPTPPEEKKPDPQEIERKAADKWTKPLPEGTPISEQYADHEGLDYAVGLGTPMKAARSGIVHYVETDVRGTGWCESALAKAYPDGSVTVNTLPDPVQKEVRITTDDGYTIIYAHLSEYKVKEGQYVTAGDLIGLSGNSGCSGGAHAHFQIIPPGGGDANELEIIGNAINPAGGVSETLVPSEPDTPPIKEEVHVHIHEHESEADETTLPHDESEAVETKDTTIDDKNKSDKAAIAKEKADAKQARKDAAELQAQIDQIEQSLEIEAQVKQLQSSLGK